MNLDIAYVSEPGERSTNEDCVDIITTDFGTCAVLCDGLGGHDAGELASACVCANIRRNFEAVSNTENISQLAYDLVLKAQNDLLQHQIEYGKTDGMKTTCCCPVSYTHLDVYKRKLLSLPKCIDSFSICFKASCSCHRSVSVSYTHLDVYKRQGEHQAKTLSF